MIPAALLTSAPPRPPAAPVVLLVASVQPRAAASFNHTSGTVQGGQLFYGDLSAFAWFKPRSGWDTRGARTLTSGRGLKGVEDNEKRKQ